MAAAPPTNPEKELTLGEDPAFLTMPTASGLWRMAVTYADAAEVLIATGAPNSHQFDEPAVHLAEQAIELALKGFLRAADRPPDDLKEFGHRLPDLLEACRFCGLDESFLGSPNTVRVVDTLVAVGKSGHGFRYPCNAANRWIEPNVAVSVAKHLIGVVKEKCTASDLLAGSTFMHTAEPAQERRDLSMVREALQAVGFIVTHERGRHLDLELPGQEFDDLTGAIVSAAFHATVQSDTGGVVITLKHISHGSESRPVYGQTQRSAAIATKIAAEDWVIRAKRATQAVLSL